MRTHWRGTAAVAAAVIGLSTLCGVGAANADPAAPSECAQGRPCASAPGCPDHAVTLPAGPRAERGEPAARCTVTTVAPKKVAGAYISEQLRNTAAR